jgi:hypothetical protein
MMRSGGVAGPLEMPRPARHNKRGTIRGRAATRRPRAPGTASEPAACSSRSSRRRAPWVSAGDGSMLLRPGSWSAHRCGIALAGRVRTKTVKKASRWVAWLAPLCRALLHGCWHSHHAVPLQGHH